MAFTVWKLTKIKHIGYSLQLTAMVLLYAPSHRQDSTYHGLCYTSRGALAGTKNELKQMPLSIIKTTYITICLPINSLIVISKDWIITILGIWTNLIARCSSVVIGFTHGAMSRRIDPSWWTHWDISRFSQCSTTGVTKFMVCAILSVGLCV